MRSKLLILTILFLLTTKTASAATIKINEFYAAGSTTPSPDWVEIYNDGTDLSLYQLMDGVNNKKDLADATCNGNFCTVDWYNYLNNNGDTIKLVLKTAIESPLDQVIYGSNGDISVPGADQSAGRNPDISGNWTISSLPTKGEPNNPSTPIPTQTATPIPSPTPSSSNPQPPSLFIISSIPSQINSDQSFSVSVNLSLPDDPNTNFSLKGAFKKTGGSNYFGFTKVSGNWIKNGASFPDQYLITTNGSGNWSGNLEIKPDSEDSGFTGTGDYIFKVGKYNTADTNPSVSWSNESAIKIISTGSNQDGALTGSSPPATKLSSPLSSKIPQVLNKQKSSDKLTYRIASVAAATASASIPASPSPNIQVKGEKQSINIIPWIGAVLIGCGIGSLIYIYLRNRN